LNQTFPENIIFHQVNENIVRIEVYIFWLIDWSVWSFSHLNVFSFIIITIV